MAESVVQNLIEFIPKVRGNGFRQLNKGMKSVHSNLFSLKNMFGAFFGYDLYSSIRRFIPAMIDTSRQMGAIHARLYAATGSASLANQEFSWLLATTEKLGLELMKTSDQYSIFAASAKEALSGGEIRETFNDMLEAQRVLHLSPEVMSRVFYAYREIASEGTLRLTRLTRQISAALPGAMPVAMKSLGYTDIKKFRADISAAKISSRDFLLAFSRGYKAAYVTQDKLHESMMQVDAQIQLMQRHGQGLMLALGSAGFDKDLIKTLRVLNKGLGFLEKHSGGLYKTLKLIGISLLAFAGVMTLINLPGTILAMAEMLTLLINIRKNLLLIQLMSAGMAGAAGIEAGAVAGILLFLTQPAIWVPLAIAALGAVLMFIIKKFFPNVWSSIMSIWVRLKILIWNLIDDINNHPAIQALKQWFGTEKKGFGKDVQDKQEAWKKITPNHEFIYNSVGFLEALGKKTYDLYNKFNPISLGVKTANIESRAIKHFIEQKYNIDIKVDGVEDKRIIMDSVNTALSNFAEQNKKKTAIDIINSKNNNRLPFTPLGSVH